MVVNISSLICWTVSHTSKQKLPCSLCLSDLSVVPPRILLMLLFDHMPNFCPSTSSHFLDSASHLLSPVCHFLDLGQLFPGYLHVRFNINNNDIHFVINVIGLIRFSHLPSFSKVH